MSRRQQRRLLRTILITEVLVFIAGLAAIGVVVYRLRLDAFGILGFLALVALFLLHRFENRVRSEGVQS